MSTALSVSTNLSGSSENIENIENTPPLSSAASASASTKSQLSVKLGQFISSHHHQQQPLSPRPINISTTPSSTAASTAASTAGPVAPPSTTAASTTAATAATASLASLTASSSVASASAASVSTSLSPASHYISAPSTSSASGLSSTTNASSAAAARYKDQIFQLNLEIQSLKQRLSLTSSASKNELLDLLSEKDSVISNKSRQINALNDKFTKITKAVNGMEREMLLLRKAKKESDDECKKVNRYLGIREKEVNVLVARCAAQEEKLNEVKGARALEKELKELKKSKERQVEDHGKEIQGLMGDLQQVGNQKQALQNEIEHVRGKVMVMEEELDRSKAEIREKQDKITNLYDELKDLHESKEKEATEGIAMRKHLQDIKTEVFKRESQLDDERTRHKNEIIRLRKELQEQKKNDEMSIAELSTEKDAEIQNLRDDLNSKQLDLDAAVDDMKHWRREHEKIKRDFSGFKKEHERYALITKEEVDAIETERINLDGQLSEKTKEVETLNKTVIELKDTNDSNAMQMNKLKEKLGFLENELRVMTEKEMNTIEAQNKKMDLISNLEETIQKMKEEKEKMKKSHKQRVDELESEGIEMQEELENFMQDSAAKLAEVKKELDIERSKAENYWSELEQLRSKSLKQEELRQVEIKLLEESVKTTKAHARSRDDEYWKFKNGEFKAAKARIVELEQKVKAAERICEQTEMDAAMIVDELNKKLVEASDRHARLEKEKRSIMTESEKAIETLERNLTTLETKFSGMKKEHQLKSDEIKERDITISNLKKDKKGQEDTVQSWKNDLDMLITAYEKCKIDHAELVKQKQCDFDEFKMKSQRDSDILKEQHYSLQKDYDSLQSLAAETEHKFEQQSDILAKTRDTLDEKKRILSEMVQGQKMLERELKEARDMIAELQDVSDSVNQQNENYKKRLQSFQLEMERDLNRHLDEIENGNLTRKELEKKMKKLEREITELRAEVKATAELRATNYLLQDKVDRQEAFLKRKLEKEKKQRMIQPHSMGSPPRGNPPRSRSITRRQADVSPRSRSATRRPTDVSKSTKIQQPRSRSQSLNRKIPQPDDELEELLS